MKRFVCVVFFVMMSLVAFCQKEKGEVIEGILDDEVFDRMIIQEISHAITGENTPVTGLKIDVSKPEGTISGTFPLNEEGSLLFGFDLKGGVTDKSFTFLKGYSELNTAFEFRPALHLMPSMSGGKYLPSKAVIAIAKNDFIKAQFSAMQDTFKVIRSIYNAHLTNFPKLQDDVPPPAALTASQIKILFALVRDVLKGDVTGLTDTSPEAAILAKVLQVEPQDPPNDGHMKSSTLNLTIVNLYKKYERKYESRETDQNNKLIANAADAWTKKKLRWISFQPFLRAEQLNIYSTNYKGIDSSYFKKDYPFHYGLGVSFNLFDIYPNRWAYLFRASVTGMQTYNTATLSSFNYETRTTLFTNTAGVTEKTKSGLAYNKSDIKSGFVTQVSLEGYILPLKSFFPGVYASTSFNMSGLYRLPKIKSRQEDKLQIALEGGFVFNVVSKEKDKQTTLLSLLFYGRFEDVTDSRRTQIETQKRETEDDFSNRNVSFGLRVGIPVNLPKRTATEK